MYESLPNVTLLYKKGGDFWHTHKLLKAPIKAKSCKISGNSVFSLHPQGLACLDQSDVWIPKHSREIRKAISDVAISLHPDPGVRGPPKSCTGLALQFSSSPQSWWYCFPQQGVNTNQFSWSFCKGFLVFFIYWSTDNKLVKALLQQNLIKKFPRGIFCMPCFFFYYISHNLLSTFSYILNLLSALLSLLLGFSFLSSDDREFRP